MPNKRPIGAKSSPAKRASETAKSKKQGRKKLTIYVERQQELALEAIQLYVSKHQGQRPTRSALVQEAFTLLIDSYRDKLSVGDLHEFGE